MRFMKTHFVLLIVYIFCDVNGIFLDYVKNIGASLGLPNYSSVEDHETAVEGFDNEIPYEVSLTDEKFIAEAIKLTGVAVSELDSCQHRVILKLHTDCHSLNDEMISKLAVALLNCQSHVENRKTYPCNEEMSLKDCTKNMDQIAWNSYLLMTNRARAVCYSVRQSQFRGLTEHTINRLMSAAKNQLGTLSKIAEDQENIQSIAQNTLQSVTIGQQEMVEQQKNLQKAQFIGQLAIESNINRLSEEKKIIMDSQRELASMTSSMKLRLEEASQQLQSQAVESTDNHKTLMKDLYDIQEKTNNIFKRIDESSQLLIRQSQLAQEQYQATINQLSEVNATVNSLVSLVGGTKQALENRLSWIVNHLGGTDEALDKVYIILWHILFLLTAMIACAFLAARTSTRLVVVIMVPTNLALSMYKSPHASDAVTLTTALTIFIMLQYTFVAIHSIARTRTKTPQLTYRTPEKNAITRKSETKEVNECEYKPSPVRRRFEDIVDNFEKSHLDSKYEDEEDSFDEYASPTPPLSRIGHYNRSRSQTPLFKSTLIASRVNCKANTRLGSACKNTSMPGRDFCHRHQKGDSVIA